MSHQLEVFWSVVVVVHISISNYLTILANQRRSYTGYSLGFLTWPIINELGLHENCCQDTVFITKQW